MPQEDCPSVLLEILPAKLIWSRIVELGRAFAFCQRPKNFAREIKSNKIPQSFLVLDSTIFSA